MQPSNTGFVDEILGWAKKPFTSDMSAFNWILFVGLLAIAAFLWHIVLLQLSNDL